jgi:N-acetylglutamate synthase-like GNAT family acetyltransferase
MSDESGTDGIAIRTDLRCGDLGRIVALHGEIYEREAEGFGLRFEAFVARTIAEFVLDNASRGRVWLAERGDELVGCCAIAHRGEALAQLRWVLARPEVRGVGLGRRLVEASLDYCREEGVERVFLETTDGLEASRRLYDSLGFRLVSETREELWDGEATLIRMALDL